MIVQKLLAIILAAATWAAEGPVEAEPITEIQIAAVSGQTEIVIIAEGAIQVSDFLLEGPTRLILDLRGAHHALPRYAYEEIGRGGVIRLRTSQFLDDVVRLVIDLTFAPIYSVDVEGGVVRVRFRNPGPPFEPWSTSLDGVEAEMALSAPGAGGAAPANPDVVTINSTQRLASVSQAQPRITVTYDSASVLDVIAGFAEFADISIVPNAAVASQLVRGIEIRDRPWDEALDAILAAQGLGWRVTHGGIIVVDRLDSLIARESLQSETRVIRINYADADSVATTLQQLVTPDLGQVVAYQGTNSVIVTDIPPVVERMDSLVSVLDRKIPQVAIEAKIVFVDRTDVFELGIVYDLKQTDGAFVTQGLNQAISVIDPTKPPQVQDLNGDGIIQDNEQFPGQREQPGGAARALAAHDARLWGLLAVRLDRGAGSQPAGGCAGSSVGTGSGQSPRVHPGRRADSGSGARGGSPGRERPDQRLLRGHRDHPRGDASRHEQQPGADGALRPAIRSGAGHQRCGLRHQASDRRNPTPCR
jgi:type IV pilus assembly protein PilQ